MSNELKLNVHMYVSKIFFNIVFSSLNDRSILICHILTDFLLAQTFSDFSKKHCAI